MKIRVMEMLGCCSLLAPLVAQDRLDLAGEWRCLPDASDVGIGLDWGSGRERFPHPIRLPGTTDEAKLGKHRLESEPFDYHLTREWEFVGPAWFAKEIRIPDSWEGREVDLFLERVMWQSRVWVDGVETGPAMDSLCIPHVHGLGKLTAGRHTIIVRVDNRMIHPIGDKGHAYGDQTQSRWNGVVGKIELRAKPANRIELLRVFPSLDGMLGVAVSGVAENREGLHLKVVMRDPALPGEMTADGRADLVFDGADGRFSASCEIRHPGKPRAWSEFDPHLCSVSVSLAVGDGPPLDGKATNFGFREVARDGNRLLINRKPAFMRGNLECAMFPKTGYPPTDVESWRKIWQVYQDHGLNHARFHSWCPPEAALTAADEMGIYLQVEAPIWMDRWMASPNSRPEMDTAGHPQGLGRGDRGNDEFAQAEIRRILDAYGNHPSFVFFCIGNELGTSDFEVTGKWMRDSKAYDPRHLYAASTARTITPFCDFNATHAVPGIGAVRQHLEFGTAWDYEKSYGRTKVPIIAHEIGQWPVYMDWERDLAKYTGPLKPYRLMRMSGEAEKSGVAAQARELRAASGAVNRILYRDEIESFLRTPSCRGVQLLGIQDFTGQGEAMVGWLDPFYESKGTTEPAEFRRYCAPTVPLLKLPGYVFRKSDKPRIEALLHHYGADDLKDERLSWSLAGVSGKVIDSGSLPGGDYPAGGVYPCGDFTPDFSEVRAPARCDLTIGIPGRKLSNIYQIWVFPDAVGIAADGAVVVTDDWEGVARAALNEGRKVVLIADRLGGRAASKLGQWQPLYWSVPFFPGQNRDTLGLMLDEKHPALGGFPTAGFGDWNWFRICQGARGFDLTARAPRELRPIAQPVTDFHLNRRLGSIFEAMVGKGSLMVCGYNIREDRAKAFPEVAQLRRSLLDHVMSEEFAPVIPMEMSALDTLFADPAARAEALPARFAAADLYVQAAAKLDVDEQSKPWRMMDDAVLRQVEGVEYSVKADGIWRDEGGSAWHGRVMTITVKARAGVPGRFFVRFHDWNGNGRTGTVIFEGKDQALPAHVDGMWLEFPVIREDTNDGQLVLHSEVLTGPNLMITDFAFVPEE
jgi:beta-galactosidase